MKALARDTTQRSEPSGITRLVAAERVWAERVTEARARAEAIVNAAREDARREIDRAGDLSALVAQRQRELTAHREPQLHAAQKELRQRRDCYSAASDETIARLARKLTALMPWFESAENS